MLQEKTVADGRTAFAGGNLQIGGNGEKGWVRPFCG
jgi:hypothetical protein